MLDTDKICIPSEFISENYRDSVSYKKVSDLHTLKEAELRLKNSPLNLILNPDFIKIGNVWVNLSK